jgi:hypothetical protein
MPKVASSSLIVRLAKSAQKRGRDERVASGRSADADGQIDPQRCRRTSPYNRAT